MPTNDHTYRRSRKHVLDWLQSGVDEFLSSLNDLIDVAGARVTPDDLWMPRGFSEPQEARLDGLDDRWLPSDVREVIANWWLEHPEGANTPNWDLLATCTIRGQRGLVLVEAKAHGNELKTEGKPLKRDASQNSRDNHARINAAIREACDALNDVQEGFAISRGSHYQLSNRIAFGWRLASLGVPAVLLYLGFVGDTGIRDSERPFMKPEEWTESMVAYGKGILPDGYVALAARDQAVLEIGCTPFALVVRSRHILSPTVYPNTAN